MARGMNAVIFPFLLFFLKKKKKKKEKKRKLFMRVKKKKKQPDHKNEYTHSSATRPTGTGSTGCKRTTRYRRSQLGTPIHPQQHQ
jgi:hypothetical protein